MATITTLSHVDISKLTQSELHSLSLLSIPPSSTSNTLSPTLSPLTFNESSASRRQTFSKTPRRTSSSTANHHPPRTTHHSTPPQQPPSPPPQNDPDSNHNKSIIFFLKNLFKASNLYNPDDEIANFSFPISQLSGLCAKDASFVGIKKRKRTENKNKDSKIVTFGQLRDKDAAFVSGAIKKRKRAGREKESASVNIVNKNGVVVNLEALSKLVDPFGEELRRRTTGLMSEEECLEFFRGLEGQWGSRRKKRKIVSACEFGDAFPVGWKLILGLRRKEGRIWVYIRRYISPTGQPFVSCKEVATFLKSYFEHSNLNQMATLMVHDVLSAREASESHAGITYKGGNPGNNLISNTSLCLSSISNVRGTEDALFRIENLSEVQVRDLFECYRCNLSFDEKETYLLHLMSSHRKTTRRYRLGSSVGDGVIVNDGKYECQFCHKIFEERRKYNSHVGVHVRGNARKSECHPAVVAVDDEKIESPSKDVTQTGFSKMDALIEIAQNSTLEASNKVNNGEFCDNSAHNGLDVAFTPVTYGVSNSDYKPETNSPASVPEMEDDTGRDQYKELNNYQCLLTKENVRCDNTMSNMNLNITAASGTVNPISDLAFPNGDNEEVGVEEDGGFGSHGVAPHRKPLDVKTNLSSAHAEIMVPQLEEVHDSINGDAEISSKISDTGPIVDVPDGNMKRRSEEFIVQPEVLCSSMAMEQSLHCFPMLGSVSVKGVDELSGAGKKLENVTSFEELKLDGIEPLGFSFLAVEESAPLPELSMEMETSNPGVKRDFDSSVGIGSGSEEDISCLCGTH